MDWRECGWCGELFPFTWQRRRDHTRCCSKAHGKLLYWRERRTVSIIRTWLITDVGIVEVTKDAAYTEPKLHAMHAAWLKLLSPERYEPAILLACERIIRERGERH